jgi:predicted outer membrane repeat protein
VGVATLAIAAPAGAKTYTVTSLANGGTGSLRKAVAQADGHAGADTITFQPGLTGTIKLRTGELLVGDGNPLDNDPLTVVGPGASQLTISGTNSSRIFHIADDEELGNPRTTISGLTLTKGSADYGGAIYVGQTGSLTLERSVVTGNSATVGGGGINAAADLPLSGKYGYHLTIDSSTVADNQAPKGAGIRSDKRIVDVTDSTVAENTASSTGGGIENLGGQVHLLSSTLAGNIGAGLTDEQGSAFYPPCQCYVPVNPQASLDDSIVANNYTPGPFSFEYDIYSANYGVDTTHSVIMNTTGAQINDNGGNFLNQDPRLVSPFAVRDNGGPTPTIAIRRTSVAVDTADSSAPATDQRGYGRTGAPDIGAFEYNGAPP